ncbi:3-methyl-2-oxobutanoate hydroxymethyltransferase [Candidatus Marinamargulisbacteria bacterium SCGC AAA071-K20]|nr:3-methyl-2-oxobutanoate hydroxymethyltransferase [Candidatus Marinamargulisbacteria bacterium SCGC AAA071-K20]
MKKNIYPSSMIDKKRANEKFVILTAYDCLTAQLLEKSGVEYILVGDSLGNMFAGYDNTLPVTVEQMIYHGKAVCAGTEEALVIMDMPYMSYQVSNEDAILNAGRLIKEAGGKAVKIEVNPNQIDRVKAVVDSGIEVIGHIGLTPQTVYQLGGYGLQGKDQEVSDKLSQLALALEKAGCFSVLFEKIPSALAAKLTSELTIPTLGIGAGVDCDGQILVTQDVLGATEGKPLKFVKQYASVFDASKKALEYFIEDVKTSQFPGEAHSF